MLRTIAKSILLGINLCCASITFAQHNIHLGTQEIDLVPGKPQRITYGLHNEMLADCDVRLAAKDNHSLFIRMLLGRADINGTTLQKGQTMNMSIYHTQLIPIKFYPSSDIEVTNKGPYTVRLNCISR